MVLALFDHKAGESAKFFLEKRARNPVNLVWTPNEDDPTTGAFVSVASDFHPGVPNATINLSLTTPGGDDVPLTATTDKKGAFSFSYTPTEVGEWGWVIYYDGETKPSIAYTEAYGEWNAVSVTSPTATGDGETPPPESGLPMEYVYVAVAVIVIVLVAIGVYMFLKRK
jgi:hypothetical protein